MEKKFDLTTIERPNDVREWMVVFDVACSFDEWCDDEGDTLVYIVKAENPARAMFKAWEFFHEQVGDDGRWNDRDVVDVRIGFSGRELEKILNR